MTDFMNFCGGEFYYELTFYNYFLDTDRYEFIFISKLYKDLKSVIETFFYVLCAFQKVSEWNFVRNEFDFWNVHEIINTSGFLQSK